MKDTERTPADLAFIAGELFNTKITSVFWSSFKGEYGHIQVSVLVYLYDHKRAKASDIAAELNVPKQHVSKIINDFKEEGMVVEEKDVQDKRSRILSLTEKGLNYIRRHLEISNQSFYSLLESMDKKDQKDFLNALEIIVRVL
ncbi:MAG: winged helix-turn-helix transcriptional regulator [Faecalicoccus sp.]|nr:winged helix-turn-helix transcriptional regulator [Faecalicoccus sp.]